MLVRFFLFILDSPINVLHTHVMWLLLIKYLYQIR